MTTDDAISVAELTRLRDAIANQPYVHHVHVVHPDHADRRLAQTAAEVDVWARCEFCGSLIGLTERSRDGAS